MSFVILDGFKDNSPVESILRKKLDENKTAYDYFKLNNMNILPCKSCGSCGDRTPGRCVLDDDIAVIMKAVAKSSTLIFLSPIRYGGYSSTLKKIVDRLMLIGLPLYMVKDGHLLHPMRYDIKFLLGIGEIDKELVGQDSCFKLLVERNAMNMLVDSKTCIYNKNDDITKLEKKVTPIINKIINQ